MLAFKSNEDGVFVNVNDQRVKSRHGNFMEGAVDVKEANARNTQNNVVSSNHLLVVLKYWLSRG